MGAHGEPQPGGLLNITHAAIPHLLTAADPAPRRVADLVNVSSVAGRVARPNAAVYDLTKFGIGGFSERAPDSPHRAGLVGLRIRTQSIGAKFPVL